MAEEAPLAGESAVLPLPEAAGRAGADVHAPEAPPLPAPVWVRPALGTLAVLLCLETVYELIGLPGPSALYDFWFDTAVIAGAGVICIARSRHWHVDSLAWAAFGAGMLGWALGSVLWQVQYSGEAHPPYPTSADVLWLLWYPFTAVGVGLLIRRRLGGFELHRWLDGLVLTLLVLAAAFPLTLSSVEEYLEASTLPAIVDVSYPLFDTLLLGAIVGTFALVAWRPGRAWALIAAGCLLMAFGDVAFAAQQARGVPGSVNYGFVWSAGALLIALAAWVADLGRHRRRELEGVAAIALPLAAAILAAILQACLVLFHSFDTQAHKVTVLVVLVIAAVQIVLAHRATSQPG